MDVMEGSAGPQHSDAAPGQKPTEPVSRISEEVVAMLGDAARPLILAGPAMSRGRGWRSVTRMSGATGIPALPMESPRGVDSPRLRNAVRYLGLADLVLLVGKKLDFTLKFGQAPFFEDNCRFIQIDSEEACFSDDERIDIRWRCDPETAVGAIEASGARISVSSGWREEVLDAFTRQPDDWNVLAASATAPAPPLSICRALQPWLDDGAILVSDGGEFGQWVQAGAATRKMLINGPGGAIGNAVSMGIAARQASPDKPVFVLTGDGAFGFHALELDTSLRYDAPVVVVIGNDATWNAEHQLQIERYGAERTVGCQLLNTRYDLLAESLGGHGEYIRLRMIYQAPLIAL